MEDRLPAQREWGRAGGPGSAHVQTRTAGWINKVPPCSSGALFSNVRAQTRVPLHLPLHQKSAAL